MGKDNHSRLSFVNRRSVLKTGAAASALGLAGCLGDDNGGGDGEYPAEPIRVIIPFSEGGGTDIYSRAIWNRMSDSDILDVNVEIENLPGAGSVQGAEEAYNAEPDGYTTIAFNPPSTPISAMVAEASDLSDLEGVCSHSTGNFMIAANPDYEIDDYDDFLNRYDDGELDTMGGKQLGTIDHAIWQVMEEEHGLSVDNYVGYDGTGPVVQSILSDEVPAGIVTASSAEETINDGSLDPVVVLTEEESLVLPDVDHMPDQGYDGIDFVALITRCFWLPPGADQEHIDTLEAAAEEAIQSDEIQEWAEENDQPVSFGDQDVANDAITSSYEDIPDAVDLDELRDVE